MLGAGLGIEPQTCIMSSFESWCLNRLGYEIPINCRLKSLYRIIEKTTPSCTKKSSLFIRLTFETLQNIIVFFLILEDVLFSQLYGISIFTYKQWYDIPKYITDLQIICVSIKKWLFANENLYCYIYLAPRPCLGWGCSTFQPNINNRRKFLL